MKALIVPIVLGLLGTGGGIGAALFLGGGAPEEAQETAADHAAGTAESPAGACTCPDSHDAVAADPAGHADDDHGGEAPTHEYVKINNQFVVPVVEGQRVEALVVLSLSVEVPAGVRTDVHTLEPKLRDVFLGVLFEHANAGHFGPDFTRDESLSILKRGLRDVARTASGGVITDVLITEIARQDA
ncbi:flagellar basal body-associated FliL family protein [Roseivivax isoporae]|uniref:Flagellar basal body-associated protein FliL n=1 Tax=Roseivivax isoporae LMG 25204 TaxID=1449351 RepID=X7F9V5_9RHOB|nr:flagellar basal body-associated FliL family protein [Roseivivax isoporae]ETX29687.1 flagellar basal body-associated protein FliL [Roseivivax isoporae LMG 25204]